MRNSSPKGQREVLAPHVAEHVDIGRVRRDDQGGGGERGGTRCAGFGECGSNQAMGEVVQWCSAFRAYGRDRHARH